MEAPSGRSMRASPWKTDLVNGNCLAAIDSVILMGFAADDGLEYEAAWRLVSFMIRPDDTHQMQAFSDPGKETINPP